MPMPEWRAVSSRPSKTSGRAFASLRRNDRDQSQSRESNRERQELIVAYALRIPGRAMMAAGASDVTGGIVP
jgi:hypothetical protein